MDPQKIIIRLPNWIGDLVMAIPLLLELRRALPDASLTAMCRAPLGSLLQEEPALDELFSFTKPPTYFSRRAERRGIVQKLQVGQYDVGLLTTNSFSSAWLFWQGGVKRRIGYRGHFRSWLLSDALPPSPEGMHQVDRYKALLAPLGLSPSDAAPRLIVTPREVERAKEFLQREGWREGSPLIGIHPGAAYGSAKCWPLERYRALTEKLLREGATPLLVGDARSQELYRGWPQGVINGMGKTNLRELMALIRCCALFITNDSGPMHIAAALHVPLLALFGSTDPKATGPYQAGEVVSKSAECSPCFRRTCPIDFRCMKGIEVEEVFQKAMAQLKGR